MTLRLPRILSFFLLFALGAASMVALETRAATGASIRVQITDENGVPVRDAVVEIHPPARATGPIRFPWRMAMAQRNLQFVPGTLLVAEGSTVAFPNLDRVRHSVYSFSEAARFEFDLYGRDQSRTYTFPKAGSVRLGCNIHDEMRGYIRVTDTPFAAVTDHNGYATLGGMPPGDARLSVWHPQLRAPGNEYRSSVTLGAGDAARRVKVRLR